MSRKEKSLFALAILVFVGCVGALLIGQSGQSAAPGTLAQTKARSAAQPPACLAQRTDPNLKVDEQIETHITNAVIANITDVPAGTNVDVYLKTYTADTATGSSIYAGKYGSYNFTTTLTDNSATNSYQGGWTVTSFSACQRS